MPSHTHRWIRHALHYLRFKSVTYDGPIFAAWNGQFLFEDFTFVDADNGENFCIREFVPGSPARKRMQKIQDLMLAAAVAKGETVSRLTSLPARNT